MLKFNMSQILPTILMLDKIVDIALIPSTTFMAIMGRNIVTTQPLVLM
jgi:hypothetical protein